MQDGRQLAVDIELDEKKLSLMNIYAPNEDKPEFFVRMLENISKLKNADTIIGGDLNLVLDEKNDSYKRQKNHTKSARVLETAMNELLLVDTWRKFNPSSFQFTHYKKKPTECYARLDYLITNYALTKNIKEVKILLAYKTDHSLVKITLELNKEWKRGPGFWKLNVSTLEKVENVNEINEIIKEIAEHADKENYEKCYKWEKIKEGIVKKCKEISKRNASKMNQDFHKLVKQIEKTQKRIVENESSIEMNSLKEQVEKLNVELSEHIQHKARGARIRSRTKWYEEGEKGTKYFLGLEETKYSNKVLNMIRCDDNTINKGRKENTMRTGKVLSKVV